MNEVSHTDAPLVSEANGVRFRFGLNRLFLLVAVACVGAFLGSVVWQRARLNQEQALLHAEIAHARSNLKRIVIALQEYQGAHRALPYSDEGADAALFALKRLIEPAAFECRSHNFRESSVRWNTGSGRLVNGDVAYLNEPSARLDRSRVVVACDLDDNLQLYATGDSVVRGRKEPIPISELLGSWVTGEGFIVVNKSTFDKWRETLPTAGGGVTRSVGGRPEPIEVTFKDGSTVQFIYVEGSLNRRKITAANGRVIDEAIETDRYGRIVGISRSPEK